MIEGPLAPARAAHARAKAARDAVGLEQAADAFEVMGAILLAAEAASDAAVAWQQRREPRKATAAERRAAALAARCDGAHTPGLADAAPARAVLTGESDRTQARPVSNGDHSPYRVSCSERSSAPLARYMLLMHLGGAGMTESEHSEPDGEPEKLPQRPGRDTKALGLEVAKLFGLPPRLLVEPPSPPADDSGKEPDRSRAGDEIDPEPEDA